VEQGVSLFQAAGVNAVGMPDLAGARWQKLVWNVPFNGLSVLLDASTAQLLGDSHARTLVQALMEEVIGGAATCGHAMPAGYAQQLLSMTERMPDYWPSMYHDHVHHRPLEIEAIYAAPLARVQAAGCHLPRMEMLYQSLTYLGKRSEGTMR